MELLSLASEVLGEASVDNRKVILEGSVEDSVEDSAEDSEELPTLTLVDSVEVSEEVSAGETSEVALLAEAIGD